MKLTIQQRGRDVDEDMRTDPNFASMVKSGSIHYVSLAEPGLNVVSAIIMGCGFDTRERNDFMLRVNHAKEAGTLYPRAGITLLPVPRASYGGMDSNVHHQGDYTEEEVVSQLLDAFKANSEYIKCKTMYFDFRNMAADESHYLASLRAAVEQASEDALPDEVITWEARENK